VTDRRIWIKVNCVGFVTLRIEAAASSRWNNPPWFRRCKGKLFIPNTCVSGREFPYTRSVVSQDSKFLLAGMQHVANNSDDLRSVVQGLVEAASACVGSNMGSLYLLDEKRGVLKPFVIHNLPESYLAGCAEVPLGTQCCGRAALHKTPWIVSDMWTDPLFADCREAAMATGMRSAFSVPVLDVNGTCKGALASHFREAYMPSPYDLERQSLFAKLIAFALTRTDFTVDQAGAASGTR